MRTNSCRRTPKCPHIGGTHSRGYGVLRRRTQASVTHRLVEASCVPDYTGAADLALGRVLQGFSLGAVYRDHLQLLSALGVSLAATRLDVPGANYPIRIVVRIRVGSGLAPERTFPGDHAATLASTAVRTLPTEGRSIVPSAASLATERVSAQSKSSETH